MFLRESGMRRRYLASDYYAISACRMIFLHRFMMLKRFIIGNIVSMRSIK